MQFYSKKNDLLKNYHQAEIKPISAGRIWRRILQVFILLLSLFTFAACSSDEEIPSDNEGTTLSFDFTIPASSNSQRSVDNTLTADDGETNVNTLQVWIFNTGGADNDTPLAYSKTLSAERYLQTNGKLKISMNAPKDLTNCDIYILANAESTNAATLDENSTRGMLKNATFNTVLQNATSKGLPMSRVVTGFDVTPYIGHTDNAIGVSLLRSICKVGFYFSKDADMHNVSINIQSITINNGMANQGNIFTYAVTPPYASDDASSSNIPTGTGYSDISFPYAGSSVSTILPFTVTKENEVSLHREPSENAQDFKTRLLNNTNHIEQAYLPESNGAATCTITYTFSGESNPHTKTFNLWQGAGSDDLIRNHEIIINGFFTRSDLYITPTVADWSNGGTTIYKQDDFVTTITSDGTNKIVKSGTTPVAIATAWEKTPTAGGHYAKFTFQFNSPAVSRWMLQLSNPAFGFKKSLYGEVLDYIDGAGGSGAVTFYIVPKNDYDALGSNNYNTTLFLILPDMLTLGKLPINASSSPLPGTISDINIQQVPSAEQFENL